MDQIYFEYHKLVETFFSVKRTDLQSATIGRDLALNQHDCPDCQRRQRMKLAFINVLREELL
jgi:hypothetical protein